MKIIDIFRKKKSNNTYIVAEIGINHEGSFNHCARMIEEISSTGADAVKLQSIDPERNYSNKTKSHKIFKNALLTKEETEKIFNIAKKYGLEIFTTIGDFKTLEEIEKFDPSCYKISSGLLTCLPIIDAVSKLNKPVLMSTGMANIKDIRKAYKQAKISGSKDLALLQCTSFYPEEDKDLELSNIQWLKHKFNCPVGFSDHSLGINNVVFAVAAGAIIIEKHYTFDKNRISFDHGISIEKNELKQMVSQIRKMEIKMGFPGKVLSKKLEATKKLMSRYLGSIDRIEKGEKFTQRNLGFLRFSSSEKGLGTNHFKDFIGKKSTKQIKKHSMISLRDCEK